MLSAADLRAIREMIDGSLRVHDEVLVEAIVVAAREGKATPGRPVVDALYASIVRVDDENTVQVTLDGDPDGDPVPVTLLGSAIIGQRGMILRVPPSGAYFLGMGTAGVEDDDIEEATVVSVVDADTVNVLLADGSTVEATLIATAAGSGDSFWEYDGSTLQPDPATTTPLNFLSVQTTDVTSGTAALTVSSNSGSEGVGLSGTFDGSHTADFGINADNASASVFFDAVGADNSADFRVSAQDGAAATVALEAVEGVALGKLQLDGAGSFSLTADDGTTSYEVQGDSGQVNVDGFVDSGNQTFLQLDVTGGSFTLETVQDGTYTTIDGTTGSTADGTFLTHALDGSDVYEAYVRTSAYRGSSAFLQLSASQPGKRILETLDADNDGWYMAFDDGAFRIDLQMLPPWELAGSGYVVLAVGSGSGSPGGVISLVASGTPDTGDFVDLALFTDGTDLFLRRADGTVLTVTAT